MTAHMLTFAADVAGVENIKEAQSEPSVFHVQVGEYNKIHEAIQNQIRLNSLGVRTGVIHENEGKTIRLIVVNAEGNLAFDRAISNSMIDWYRKLKIDAKLVPVKGQGSQNQVSSSRSESEIKMFNSPTSNKEWYQYLSGRWASGDKCLSSKNDNDGGEFQVSWGLLITAISYRQIVDGRVSIEGTFFVSAKDASEEATYTGYIDKVNGQKANIRSDSLLRYRNPDSYLIISQSVGNDVVISNGRHVKTGEEVILNRCDTPDARADRQRFQEKIALEQREKQVAMKAQQDANDAAVARWRVADREEKERIEQEKKQAVEREKQRIERERERCLSDGSIGICQSASQNNTQFICDRNSLTTLDNVFNRYCYVTDRFNIVTKMEVRNNLQKPVKDINFRCAQIAKSGTILRENISTIFDLWNPGEVKMISLSFTKHDQVASMRCISSSWK